jgi:hypothetical protein
MAAIFSDEDITRKSRFGQSWDIILDLSTLSLYGILTVVKERGFRVQGA